MLSGLLVGGLLLTSGAIALAGDNTNDSSTQSRPGFGQKMPGGRETGMSKDVLENVLNAQVDSGTLTQKEADALLAFMEEQNEQRQQQKQEQKSLTAEERKTLRDENQFEKTNLFAQAVELEIITQDQADAIQEAMRTQMQENRQASFEKKLDELVADNTINQEQAEAILEQMENIATEQHSNMEKRKDLTEAKRQEMMEQRKAEMEKIKNMTEAERQEYMQQNRPELPNPFQELVDNGTLTQEQAQAVQKALHSGHFLGKPELNQ